MKFSLCIILLILTTILYSHTKFIEKKNQMTNSKPKILIAYASEAGSTAEIASFINDILLEAGLSSTHTNIKNINSFDEYDVIFIGSPIYMGKWKKEATKFIEKNQKQLNNKKVFYFLTCISLTLNDEEKLAEVPNFLNYERSLIKPLSEGRFAGVINPKKLSFMQKMIIKMVKAPEGDFRNWEEITQWTKECLSIIKTKTVE